MFIRMDTQTPDVSQLGAKRRRRILVEILGLALLFVLAGIIVFCGRPRPVPPAPAAVVSPSATPTLRSPQPIVTPPPTTLPGANVGEGKG